MTLSFNNQQQSHRNDDTIIQQSSAVASKRYRPVCSLRLTKHSAVMGISLGLTLSSCYNDNQPSLGVRYVWLCRNPMHVKSKHMEVANISQSKAQEGIVTQDRFPSCNAVHVCLISPYNLRWKLACSCAVRTHNHRICFFCDWKSYPI